MKEFLENWGFLKKRPVSNIRRFTERFEFEDAPKDLTGVFAVSDQEPWWLAVMQVLDQYEREIIKDCYDTVANTNVCINSLGHAEGIKLVRDRLNNLREQALNKKVA